jgi:hypothetical protein
MTFPTVLVAVRARRAAAGALFVVGRWPRSRPPSMARIDREDFFFIIPSSDHLSPDGLRAFR